MTATSLRFDRFEIQPHERRLLDAGRPVPVGPRAFDVLLALAGRAGHLVTKAELLDQVWPGLVVEENNLAAQVSALRKILGGEVIATIPGRGYRFTAVLQTAAEEGAAPTTVAAPTQAQGPAQPLPAAGPRLFGRDADLARVQAQLEERAGCVTLVGAAGVGKTRLAQAVAAGWQGRCVWVDLAPLTGRSQIHGALGRALDTPLADEIPASVLARALHGDRVLVVLDNAEHVVDDLAALVSLIASVAPHVRVLVTSQLPLAIREERVDRLEPLRVAPATAPEAEALSHGAMALLVDRIGAADHRFRVTPAALPLLREICVHLDGMPLALEMAAARVPLLGLQGVNDALSERFALLTTGHRVAPGRHKTLHAALDWSHGLLGDAERRLFRTLGVFSGGFTLDLIAAVAADEHTDRWSVIDRLAVLVDRSLVAANHDDPPRYHLLETMRAYALEQLAASGEEQAARRRHAHALTHLIERADTASNPGEKLILQKQAHAEIANVREALTWALRNDSATAVRLAARVASVATFTLWRGETLAWLAACEPLVDARIDVQTRALWLFEYARQLTMNSRAEALEYAARARDLYRELGEDLAVFKCRVVLVRGAPTPGPELDANCTGMEALLERHPEWPASARMMAAGALAVASELRGDIRNTLVYREQELSLALQIGNQDQADAAESNVVFALFWLGHAEEALARSTRLMQRIGQADTANAAYAWANHIDLLAHAGRYDAAFQHVRRLLELARRFDAAIASDVVAMLVARLGRPRAAAQLIGYSWRTYGDRAMADSMLKRLEAAQSLVREKLDEATVARLIEEGRSLDDAAVDRLVFATVDE